MRACPPAPGHREVLVPGQWELKEAEKRRREVRYVVIIVHYCDYCISLWSLMIIVYHCGGLVMIIPHHCGLVMIILHYCGGLVMIILHYCDGLVVMGTCAPLHIFCALSTK